VRNPPISPVVATFAYSGPPISVCGSPAIAIANSDGTNIGFLVAYFDSVNGIVSISVPNSNTAVKGDYTLNAVFTQPGSFNFPLGLTL
jgi:hypothetical protein